MKLLYCLLCGDVVGLLGREWRVCVCGASGGQYNADMMTATLGGAARVFGVANPFFNELFPLLDAGQRAKVRTMYHYDDRDGEVWWGEFEGDVQIFRVADPAGPRLEVKVESAEDPKYNRVAVVDERPHTVDGTAYPNENNAKCEVYVPANPRPARRQLIEKKAEP